MSIHPSESGARSSLRVVYIEDDVKLARLTADYLATNGIEVVIEGNAEDGIATVLRIRPDVVLLDLMLPTIDGLEACRRIRTRTSTPIIMLTARHGEVERILGLEGGADDYLAKPVSPRELLARIRAQARRASGRVGPATTITVGKLFIDLGSRVVTLDGKELQLTTYEFELLRALAERPGHVLSREQLVETVRGSADEAFDRSIDVRVSHLRRKLGDESRNPKLLKTVRGVGYVLATER